MPSPISLQVLATNRDALLLAEVAAWLHNIGKFSEEFLYSQFAAAGNPSYQDYATFKYQHVVGIVADAYTDPAKALPGNVQRRLRDMLGTWDIDKTLHFLLEQHPQFVDWLRNTAFRLPTPLDDREYTIGELIEFQDHKWYKGVSPLILQLYPSGSIATGLLEASHHAGSGVEKEETQGDGSQRDKPVFLATAFGYETETDSSKWARLRAMLIETIRQGKQGEKSVFRDTLGHGLGDTRRPINEVTLWDLSSTVAAFYKAATAKLILDGKWTGRGDLKWRILRVAVDGLAYYGQAARLPDLQARQDLLRIALNQVQALLEETYPTGNEVYRDETGSAFLVPDLDGDDERSTLLKGLLETEIRQPFRHGLLGGEIVPRITVSQADARGLKLADELAKPVPELQADPAQVAIWWQDNTTDTCPVCGLRPQGFQGEDTLPDKKALARKACGMCEQRRADRAKDWAVHLDTTIWTDEVADTNGRLALIAGQFDLTQWLDGTMVQTLLVTDPASGDPVAKNPSFARLRRVWETTKRFWEETQVAFPDTVGPASPRLEVVPQNRAHLDLGRFHTYELLLGRIRLSVVWDSDNCRFITCDNLDYLAKPEQAGQPIQQAIAVGQTFSIEEPAGYGSKNKIWGKITAEHVNELPGKYTPAIPILAEPRTFMALVPADKALKVVKAIQVKYEREMSKVRNRLPLTLGVVYFGRRTPLAAAMDAGRRMLKAQVTSDRWQVARNDERGLIDAPDYLKTSSHFDQWREVRLRSGERELSVHVSTVMGDGTTSDAWYPYWRVENNPTGRVRQFTGPDGEQWVHVCDLQPGDQVGFTPSTFDFEYLDTTARRFEVSYDGGHRRGKDKRQRPYLLEEIEQLERVWEMLKPPESTSQVTGLAALIETKRADWKKPTGAEALASPDDDPFRQLCHDALANTAWRGKKWKDLTEEDKRFLERAARSGMLADALELHLTIAKEGNGTQEAV